MYFILSHAAPFNVQKSPCPFELWPHQIQIDLAILNDYMITFKIIIVGGWVAGNHSRICMNMYTQ